MPNTGAQAAAATATDGYYSLMDVEEGGGLDAGLSLCTSFTVHCNFISFNTSWLFFWIYRPSLVPMPAVRRRRLLGLGGRRKNQDERGKLERKLGQ